MSDSEFAAYDTKQRKANSKNEWTIFTVLVVVGIAYYIYTQKKKNK
jgi:hypothetical protein